MIRVLAYFILFLLTLNAGSQVNFQKIIGNANSTYAYDVIQVQDTGYVIAGSSTGYGDHSANAFLMKLDSTGNFLWTKSYGGNNIEGAKQVLENADGSLMLIGHTNSSGNGGYDIYLIKTDADGNLIWEKTFGGTDWDFGYSIAPVTAGGYIITGETYSFGSGNNDAFLLRLDNNGDSLWMKTYGSSKNEISEKVVESYDGGFLFIGTSDSLVADTSKMWLVKTTSDGTYLWGKYYGTSLLNTGKSLFESAFNAEIVINGSSDSISRQWENHIYKLDSTGNFICNWTFGGPDNDYGNDITELPTGDMLMAGGGYSYSIGQSDMKFFRAMQGCWWNGGNTYGDNENQTGYAIAKTMDGGFIEAGTSDSGPGIVNIFVVKCDNTFAASGSIVTYFDVTAVEALQNESDNYIYFDQNSSSLLMHFNKVIQCKINVYDLSGKLVESVITDKNSISLTHLKPGYYIYQLDDVYERLTGKFVKL